jgi:transcriptional regulator with XRE-family HTH domain
VAGRASGSSPGIAPRAARQGSNHGSRGLTLREVRKLRGLSIREVERLTGINRARLSMMERNHEKPQHSHLAQLSHLYGVDPDAWELVVEYRIPEETA